MEREEIALEKILDRVDYFLDRAVNEAKRGVTKEEVMELFATIDLTSLSVSDTSSKISSLIEAVNDFENHFPNYPSVAALCLYPNFAKQMGKELSAKGVKRAVVSALFPASQGELEVKVLECKRSVENGAEEVDIVFPVGLFLEGEGERVKEELTAMREAVGDATLKVIIESGVLKSRELIYKAAWIAMECGANFVKTSTGKVEVGATPEAAATILLAIKEFYRERGTKVGFKASGGISTVESGALYRAIVKEVVGEEWLKEGLFRIGASRLANNLLTILEEKEISYY